MVQIINVMKKQILSLALLVGFGMAVNAVPLPAVNGSIAFNGVADFNGATVASSTGFDNFTSEYVAPGQQFGSYASVLDFTTVSFTPFLFSASGVTPLWTFTIGATTYSFDATSISANYDSGLNIWNIGGSGIAHITGYTSTAGSWNLSAGAKGASFFFGSATTVPDGGLTAGLLGLGMLAVSGVRRFLKR